MTLIDGENGHTYTITGYTFSNFQTRAKLLALGLTRGSRVKIVRTAPLGDPVVIEIRGYELSLRKEELRIVNVRPCKD